MAASGACEAFQILVGMQNAERLGSPTGSVPRLAMTDPTIADGCLHRTEWPPCKCAPSRLPTAEFVLRPAAVEGHSVAHPRQQDGALRLSVAIRGRADHRRRRIRGAITARALHGRAVGASVRPGQAPDPAASDGTRAGRSVRRHIRAAKDDVFAPPRSSRTAPRLPRRRTG